MRGSHKASGFTIIETLIVLTVSGALFVSATYFLSGDQDRTEFTQSIQAVQSQIQQVINEVESGSYANTNNFTCSGTASGPSLTTSGTDAQGSNTGCIFLGKVIQFGVANTSPERS